MADRWARPTDLRGPHAALVPLSQDHAADLAQAAADGDLHRLWYTSVPAPDQVRAEITRRLTLCDQGGMVPFAVLDPSGRAVGMTTYMNIDHANQRLEIGSTWYRRSVQRSALNTQCKRLLLGHAFDTLGAIAVEFRTHFLNHQSRRAIERLGAKLDGVLRSHMTMPNGSLRDTAVYSILAHEWPAVRANLDLKLAPPA
ncbi:MAG: GNAT family N-acetyltransferase [Marinibacterium sp.]|nr:GNAT family N-acetyltransferase [Marinibacterium sp.]